MWQCLEGLQRIDGMPTPACVCVGAEVAPGALPSLSALLQRSSRLRLQLSQACCATSNQQPYLWRANWNLIR